MNLKEQLTIYKKMTQLEPREAEIHKIVSRSEEIFFQAELKEQLSYHEFLWAQLRVIQKRWWLLQFLLMCWLKGMRPNMFREAWESWHHCL